MIELLTIILLVAILSTGVLIYIRPDRLNKQSRDERRIADITVLSAALERYIADNSIPPDADMRLRTSTQASSSTTLAKVNGTGWIPVDLSKYIEKLPVDPLNAGKYVYRYYRSGNLYKLDAVMEYSLSQMQNANDGGNDACHYEIGTGLTKISMPNGC